MIPKTRKFAKPEPSQDEIRQLPCDYEAEESVLGAMLVSSHAILKAQNICKEEDFYREAHRILFKTLTLMDEKRQPIDTTTLSTELRRTEGYESVGGLSFITSLIEKVPTAANIEYYAQTVKEKSLARKCISHLTNNTAALYAGDEPHQILDDLFNFCTTDFGKSAKDFDCDIQDQVLKLMDKLERSHEGKRKPHIKSGFRGFDSKFQGWECGSLTIILAPPKVGKSQLMMGSCDRIAQSGIQTAYILLDMMREKIYMRFISRRLKRTLAQIETGVDTPLNTILDQANEIIKLPLKVAGQENVGHDYKSTIRFIQYAHKNFGTRIAFIDSFQKFNITPEKGQTDESFISNMINDFQALAQELDIAIVGTVDQGYSGNAKGSSRWSYGVDAVFELVLNEDDNTLIVKSKFVRNCAPGEIFLSTNYSHSELMDREPREDLPRGDTAGKRWNPE